ncbi:MAG: hypothetical protein R3C56_35895 [Pirellulaceae bacterium]
MKGDYLRDQRGSPRLTSTRTTRTLFRPRPNSTSAARVSQALEDYTRAIATSESDPQYYSSRGHCRFMLEAYDDALADYLRTCEQARGRRCGMQPTWPTPISSSVAGQGQYHLSAGSGDQWQVPSSLSKHRLAHGDLSRPQISQCRP